MIIDWSKQRWMSWELVTAFKITNRRLQWADERGYVKAWREGHARFYSLHQAIRAALVFRMAEYPIAIRNLAAPTQKLDCSALWDSPASSIVWMKDNSGRHRVTIFSPDKSAEALIAIVQARAPAIIISIDQELGRLRDIKMLDEQGRRAQHHKYSMTSRYTGSSRTMFYI